MATQVFDKENLNEHARQNRQREFVETTDAMFMKAQRGEISMEDWVAAVEAVRSKYPYATEDLVVEVPDEDIAVSEAS